MNNESSPKEEMNLTIVSDNKATEESHTQRGKIFKGVGLKRMSKEEIDKEIADMNAKISHLRKLV